MADILVVGWISLDFIGHVDEHPTPGAPAIAGEFDAACGGRGANQAMAVTAVEGSPALIARLGADQHASVLREELTDLGIDDSYVSEAPVATSLRTISQREMDNSQAVVIHPGANDYLTVDDLNRRSSAFVDAKVVAVTAEPAGAVVLRALELAAQHNCRSVLTHVPGAHLSDQVISGCDVLVVSSTLANGVLDPELATTQPEFAARALHQRGAKAVILLTPDAAMLATADGAKMMPSPTPLDKEDSADAFVGGLVTGMAVGETLEQALVRGVRIACLLVD
jgi:ribokinase